MITMLLFCGLFLICTAIMLIRICAGVTLITMVMLAGITVFGTLLMFDVFMLIL